MEEAYEALKTLEILGIDKKSDLSSATCENVVKVLASPSSALKDVFYALRVNGILKCKSGEDVPKVNSWSPPYYLLKWVARVTSSLLCFPFFEGHCL